jgi:hypothetical protein
MQNINKFNFEKIERAKEEASKDLKKLKNHV